MAKSILAVILVVGLGASLISAKVNHNKDPFSKMEFNHTLSGLQFASGSSADQIKKILEEKLEFLQFATEIRRYKLFFADSNDRVLKAQNLLLRVRADLNTPEKSEIVLKSRGLTPEQAEVFDSQMFESVSKEIDVNGGKEAYSVSHTLSFVYGTDLDPDQVSSFQQLLDFIGIKSAEAKKLIEAKIGAASPIIPGSVERLKMTATYHCQEVTLEVWILAKAKYLTALSFKGPTKNREQLETLYADLKAELEARGLLTGDQISKTDFYFRHFGFPDTPEESSLD